MEQAPPIVLEPIPETEPEEQKVDSDSEGAGAEWRIGSFSTSSWNFQGRYLGSIGLERRDVGWEGGGSLETPRSLRTFPISPNTPMFVGYAGRAEEGEDSARPPQPSREMGRIQLFELGGTGGAGRGPPRRGTSSPDTKFLSEWARYMPHFNQNPHFFSRGIKGGKGRRRRREGRGENGHVACCTLLPLTLICRASYFYSAGCELHCLPATLSGHGY